MGETQLLWSLFKKREKSLFPRLCRYLKSYTVSQNLQRWRTRSASLEGMSFERIVSGRPGRGNPAKAEASQTLILFLLLAIPHYDHMWESTSQQKHTQYTHITINKDMLWMSRDFNSRKISEVSSRISWTPFVIPVEVSGSGHLLYGWSFYRGHVHCSFWSCNWTKTRLIHEYCLIFI